MQHLVRRPTTGGERSACILLNHCIAWACLQHWDREKEREEEGEEEWAERWRDQGGTNKEWREQWILWEREGKRKGGTIDDWRVFFFQGRAELLSRLNKSFLQGLLVKRKKKRIKKIKKKETWTLNVRMMGVISNYAHSESLSLPFPLLFVTRAAPLPNQNSNLWNRKGETFNGGEEWGGKDEEGLCGAAKERGDGAVRIGTKRWE